MSKEGPGGLSDPRLPRSVTPSAEGLQRRPADVLDELGALLVHGTGDEVEVAEKLLEVLDASRGRKVMLRNHRRGCLTWPSAGRRDQ